MTDRGDALLCPESRNAWSSPSPAAARGSA